MSSKTLEKFCFSKGSGVSLLRKTVLLRSALWFWGQLWEPKNPRTAGDLRKRQPIWWLAFTCKHFSHLSKSPLADINFQYPLFSFAQNRGKFAPNCLALPLAPPAPQSGTQGQTVCKKSEPLWLASLHCFLFYELLYSFDENYSQSDRIFSRSFAFWQNALHKTIPHSLLICGNLKEISSFALVW